MRRADRLTRLRDANRVVKVPAQEHTADGVVADCVTTELECLTHSAIFRSTTTDDGEIGYGLGQPSEEGGRVEIIGIREDDKEIIHSQVRTHASRYFFSRLVSTPAQLWHEEALCRKHIRSYGKYRYAGSALDLSVAG